MSTASPYPPYQSSPMQGGGTNAPTLPPGVTISQGGPGQDPAGTIEIGSGYQGGGGGWRGIDQMVQQGQQQQPTTPGAAQGQGSNAQNDALAILQGVFQQYGFSDADQASLASWAWNLITQGYDATAIQTQLYNTPQFHARFPAIFDRQKAGLPPISPGEYVSFENQAFQVANQYGVPQSFIRQFVPNWLGLDVSMAEVGQRLQDYAQAAYASNPAVTQQLQQLYGVTPGELVAFFADPDTALPIIQQRFQSAQIAGQAQIAGYGQLSQDQAQLLAQQGVTQAQAQSGFQQLGLEQQLFQPLPGESGQPGIDMTTQLGAAFLGNAQDIRQIQLEALRRQAQFQGGGAFASGQKGLTGIGSEQASQA